jgi:hypothetical protein
VVWEARRCGDKAGIVGAAITLLQQVAPDAFQIKSPDRT